MFATTGISGRTNAVMPDRRYMRPFKRPFRWDVVRFLSSGATVLMILGLAGVLGVLDSISHASLFTPPHWISWLHLSFGTLLWTIVIFGTKRLQVAFTILGAIAATPLGLVGLTIVLSAWARHGMSQVPDLSDPLVHLSVGTLAIVALWNSRNKKNAA